MWGSATETCGQLLAQAVHCHTQWMASQRVLCTPGANAQHGGSSDTLINWVQKAPYLKRDPLGVSPPCLLPCASMLSANTPLSPQHTATLLLDFDLHPTPGQ